MEYVMVSDPGAESFVLVDIAWCNSNVLNGLSVPDGVVILTLIVLVLSLCRLFSLLIVLAGKLFVLQRSLNCVQSRVELSKGFGCKVI